MKDWKGIVLTIVLVLLATGIIWFISNPPHGEPVQLIPPPTTAPYLVHVAGEVINPGVYPLPPDSRVEDAVLAAGGFKQNADMNAINLALPLQDGIQIWVPPLRSDQDVGNNVENQGSNESERFIPIAFDLININKASQEELEALPEIGPTKAAAIISYRLTEGFFTSIEELQKVSGIGPAIFEIVKDLITVDGP